MTNTSVAWTIQQKREKLNLKKTLKRLSKLHVKHGAKLYKATREWKKRKDGSINDHIHFFVVFCSSVGKAEFVRMLFNDPSPWLIRQATPVARGTYHTFDEYLTPNPDKPKYRDSPGKILLRYPEDDVSYHGILLPIKKTVATQGSLFKELGQRIADGESVNSLVQQTPYLAIHVDKLLKIKGQFFRNMCQRIQERERESEEDERDIYYVNFGCTLDNMFPQFFDYIDQSTLVIRYYEHDYDRLTRFITYIKWSNYVQLNKWTVRWLYLKFYILIKLQPTPIVVENPLQQWAEGFRLD